MKEVSFTVHNAGDKPDDTGSRPVKGGGEEHRPRTSHSLCVQPCREA